MSTTAPRLQKYLADLGFGSRRQLEAWIDAGRVSVNGQRAILGQRVETGDVVRVDGKKVSYGRELERRTRVLRYHKPVGEVCSRASENDVPSVFASLPSLRSGRWIGVGRLDITTSGLLLFTNDGQLAHRLMHPSSGIVREYAVRVRGEVSAATLSRLSNGVELDDGMAHFDKISRRGGEGANQWFHVELAEGRNREVRRLWESQSVQVSRLTRVRYGPMSLPRSLRPGRWEEVNLEEVRALQKQVGLAPAETPKPATKPKSRSKPPVRPARRPRRKVPRTRPL